MKHLKIIAPANINIALPLRKQGEKNLHTLGWSVRYAQYVDHDFCNMAGIIQERVFDLEAAFNESNIDLVMAAYGGYNTNQLLSYINHEKLNHQKLPKSFIGYGDITALLLYLSQHTTIQCYHGPSFSSFCDPALFEYTQNNFLLAIAGEKFSVSDPGFFADDAWYLKENYGPRETKRIFSWSAYQTGVVSAPIMGGNLETLCKLIGTPYFPDFNKKILFIEDTIGNLNIFHRNMTHLALMKVFDSISGLIVGKFPSQSILNNNHILFSVLDNLLPKKNYPILCHVHCSHVDPMLTIPIGKLCTLKALKNDPYLTLNV